MIRCDESGLPKVVQSIRFDRDTMGWSAQLFTGEGVWVNLDNIPIGTAGTEDQETLFDVESYIEKHYLANIVDVAEVTLKLKKAQKAAQL